MKLSVEVESWPIRGGFRISRGVKHEANVIVATIRDGKHQGRGECVAYKRYEETTASVVEWLQSAKSAIEDGLGRYELQSLLPAGAARNALDCAFWDLDAKRNKKTIWELLSILPQPKSISFTISLDTPEIMAEKAAEAAKKYSILKLKLGAEGDEERLAKVREAVPKARLIVDVNEGWNKGNIEAMIHACEAADVDLIEQPLLDKYSNVLKNIGTSITFCADESAHTSEDIPKIADLYQAVNIKLDKAGGLTEALKMAKKAKRAGLKVMVGCHVSTSLSMAPATILAQYADYIDLDGPLLLERDREPSIEYRDGMILPTTPAVWG